MVSTFPMTAEAGQKIPLFRGQGSSQRTSYKSLTLTRERSDCHTTIPQQKNYCDCFFRTFQSDLSPSGRHLGNQTCS